MRCKKDYEFIVLEEIGHIELRKKDGTFISSIACRKCLPELEKAIKKLKSLTQKELSLQSNGDGSK